MSTAGPEVTTTAPININKWLEASTFNGFHMKMFVACLVLYTMEGYDLFVIGSALPLLMKTFHLTAAQAGSAASAAAIGTLLGSLFLAPLGDTFGRRKVILTLVVLACASMAMAGLSQGLTGFWLSRLVFGIANGALLANIMALVSEYVPGRSRATVVGLIASGMQVGGMIGAGLGILLFPRYGWRPIFYIAAAIVLLFPMYQRWIPEGTAYLAMKNRMDVLRSYARKARPTATLPDDAVIEIQKSKAKLPLTEVFREHRAAATLLFWLCYVINTYVNYGFSFWLPKLMMNKGFSLSRSISFMFALSISSIVMTFIAGRIVDRYGAKLMLAVLFLLSCASIAMMGYTNKYVLLMILTGLAGAGINGAQNMINAYSPAYYPPSMRSTVMGFNFTIGRVGGIIGPMLVGLMLTMHISTTNAMLLIGLPSALSAIVIGFVAEKYNYTRQLAAAK